MDIEVSESEDEEAEDEERKAERFARRLAREVKMMSTKLDRIKEKERTAKKDRENLRETMKTHQNTFKCVTQFWINTIFGIYYLFLLFERIELKKFKKLQREVDKMAAMMRDDDDDDEAKEEILEEDDVEESEESDSDDSDDGTESEESESEPEVCIFSFIFTLISILLSPGFSK